MKEGLERARRLHTTIVLCSLSMRTAVAVADGVVPHGGGGQCF
ncbi:MAG TPA: hypothetical protein VMD28_01535 [Acidimicrobiales bacterium]|nr:hypothetical protein [Acidimicrobiales bacterium]